MLLKPSNFEKTQDLMIWSNNLDLLLTNSGRFSIVIRIWPSGFKERNENILVMIILISCTNLILFYFNIKNEQKVMLKFDKIYLWTQKIIFKLILFCMKREVCYLITFVKKTLFKKSKIHLWWFWLSYIRNSNVFFITDE